MKILVDFIFPHKKITYLFYWVFLLRRNNAISQRVAALSLLFQLLHWLLIGKQAFLCIRIAVGVCQNTGC